jgi:hypothetical protein
MFYDYSLSKNIQQRLWAMKKQKEKKKRRERIKKRSPSLINFKRRRENHMQKRVHHPSTIYTHMHILIRLYDLLLPRIHDNT